MSQPSPHLSSQRLANLAAAFGTPTYVYDLDMVRQRASQLRAAIAHAPCQLLYAIKANPCPALVTCLLDEGFGIDAVSPGEMHLALRLGCPPERLCYTENNMTDDEQRDALAQGVMINCGSLQRLQALAAVGAGEVAVRFNPDVGASEHAHTLTAGPLTKFGVHHSQIDQVLAIEAQYDIQVVGCHMHIGSNVLDAQHFAQAMRVILSVAKALPNLRWLDVGGGLGVPYHGDQQPIDLSAVGAAATAMMQELEAHHGRSIQLRLEPGRFLVAEAGTLLTTVTTIKTNPDGRCFVGCDSGFNHLLRPTMYGSYHPISNISAPDAPEQTVDVVGNICESGDIFARDRVLPRPQINHVLAIGCAGAYGMSMASVYNLRPLPAEVVLDGSATAVVRQRLSVDDLLAHSFPSLTE
ncbi:MAG: diaminopimelate decarboxylase [Planctomycetota bacterium]|nr:MAG: diaminopimelate decarboxylase [Planctomycetota bacterium]